MTDKKRRSAQGEPDEKPADPPIEVELSPDLFPKLSPEEEAELEKDWHALNNEAMERHLGKDIDKNLAFAYQAARLIVHTEQEALDYLKMRLPAIAKEYEAEREQENMESGEQSGGDDYDDDIAF